MHYFTWKLELVSNMLWVIVENTNILNDIQLFYQNLTTANPLSSFSPWLVENLLGNLLAIFKVSFENSFEQFEKQSPISIDKRCKIETLSNSRSLKLIKKSTQQCKKTNQPFRVWCIKRVPWYWIGIKGFWICIKKVPWNRHLWCCS